ncbi:hypothetical protein M422DRAFT_271709 [Sphaerobolus stellatus SS14]|uniref:Uncharacterized protein n=1 Tax=Sphaerobolus stellatus (strain SS14) TaxID=990650 RepID=A0A0C9UNU3_SPHS4|nr:hypothetical protein M422DRAFT_271709 [Sphaerobolus stellatus SS14]
MATTRISIDTSYKCIAKWLEFEKEAFFPSYNRSIVVARAFIMSQSAAAHLLLFRCIYHISQMDTGRPFRLRYAHGEGLDSITADRHRGQAVGMGLFCQETTKSMPGNCAYDPGKPLCELTAYDHLKQLYRYCLSHYTRHVRELRGHVESQVLTAMMSLATADILPEHVYKNILQLIRRSSKKRADWLKDKEAAEGWAMAAIYRGKSLMPLSIWKAAPSTSNVNVQKRKNIANDKELEKRYQDLQKLEKEASIQTKKFKRVFAKGKDTEQPFKKLKSIESQYSSLLSGVKQLQDKSTGEVAMPSLKRADQLIEWSSLAALPTVDRISQALPHPH